MAPKGTPIYPLSRGRASHSILNYLLGRVFSPFGEIYTNIEQVLYSTEDNDSLDEIPMNTQFINENEIRNKLWTLVALYHDIGYFQEAIKDIEFAYDSYTYQLYTDDMEGKKECAEIKNFSQKYSANMAYSYSEILAYDKYDRERRKRDTPNDKERINHGILGGAYLFDHLMNKGNANNMDKILLVKSVCMCIAQHNIFKSSEDGVDNELSGYKLDKLRSDSPFVINRKYPLLLFLSLVDTIECVKKFGKSSNAKRYLQTKTVLSGISVEVSENEIRIDYSELLQRILEKDRSEKDQLERNKIEQNEDNSFERNFVKYIESVGGLGRWTSFKTEEIKQRNDIVVEIRITI